jgi:hypothetical protein
LLLLSSAIALRLLQVEFSDQDIGAKGLQADTATKSPASRETRPAFTVAPRAIANMCFGLFGVQIVWGLQNVDTSRIFQTLGANLE